MVASFQPNSQSSNKIHKSLFNRINALTMQQFDWKSSKKATEEKMSKSLESMQSQFNTLRTGN